MKLVMFTGYGSGNPVYINPDKVQSITAGYAKGDEQSDKFVCSIIDLEGISVNVCETPEQCYDKLIERTGS